MTALSARLNIPSNPELVQEQTKEDKASINSTKVVSQGKNSFNMKNKTICLLHQLQNYVDLRGCRP